MLNRHKEILKILRATPVVLRALVGGTDDARLRRRSTPGEWAIIVVIGHLANTEERVLARVRRMLAEDNPQLEPFHGRTLDEEGHYMGLDLEGELDRLEQIRRRHIAVLEALDGPDWQRTGQVEEHGTVSVELYETHVAAEEVEHLAQIARLL